jgi:hypothetical protein
MRESSWLKLSSATVFVQEGMARANKKLRKELRKTRLTKSGT